MRTVPEIIEAFGGPTEFGRVCGFHRHPGARGSDMKQRGSIPVSYWSAIVEAARQRELAITLDVLVAAHAPRRDRSTPQVSSAA